MNDNILLIEDDTSIREGICILLSSEGFHVTEAKDGFEGLRFLTNDTHLVILDIMMPGISGIKTCEEIRKKSNVPVLFLTAKNQEADKLIGLMVGGDDYLVKPFSYAELTARVKALLRRYRFYDNQDAEISQQCEWIESGQLRLHTGRNEVYLDEKEISLTELEYRILLLFMGHPKQIFSVKNIYESVWEEPFVYSSGNTVMVHIRRLRIKIERNPQKPQIIQTVWGKGYCFGKNSFE